MASGYNGTLSYTYDDNGNSVVQYAYDAWGKVLSITGSMADTIGTINPLLYRGYIYDHDTGLYYLQSRYYNPTIGRFICADVYVATGQGLLGNNMFAYCGNNPVVYRDLRGTFSEYIPDSPAGALGQLLGEWLGDWLGLLTEDARNYDEDSTDEQEVFNSNVFSSYRGVLVIKTDFEASFSFGFIGLSKSQQTPDTLKHEYGHTVQLEQMGFSDYVSDVTIPSILINILDRQGKLTYDYYSYPWEAEANELGGSTLSQWWKQLLPADETPTIWELIKLLLS